MHRYKVCVYAISKNEEAFVDRWMDSMQEADLVVVADTGSTDATVEKLRTRGATVVSITVDPWRFDTARNLSLSQIPSDIDICFCLDLDEVFESGWRDALERAWTPDATLAEYPFNWSIAANGQPDITYLASKAHGRHDYVWEYPVHERLKLIGDRPEKKVSVPDLVLNHYPDNSKSRGSYLPLLELCAKEYPEDDRTSFWLGREYVYRGQYDNAIEELTRHLSLPSAIWDEERSASMRFMAEAYYAKGDIPQAKHWLFRAIAACGRIREPYTALARIGYATEDWPLVLMAVSSALERTHKGNSYLVEPESWGGLLYDYGAIACYQLGLYDRAAVWARTACDFSPQDERLKNNLALILQACESGGQHT